MANMCELAAGSIKRARHVTHLALQRSGLSKALSTQVSYLHQVISQPPWAT